jgi:hypothetical protein
MSGFELRGILIALFFVHHVKIQIRIYKWASEKFKRHGRILGLSPNPYKAQRIATINSRQPLRRQLWATIPLEKGMEYSLRLYGCSSENASMSTQLGKEMLLSFLRGSIFFPFFRRSA